MAKQLINLGVAINDGTGDTLRSGAQKINDNFNELYNSLSYSLPIATPGRLGGVKLGANINQSADGTISVSIPSTPTASTSVLGFVKVDGSSITINNGVISAAAYTLPIATPSVLGGVKVDGTSITIDNGVISAASAYTLPIATPSVLGGVKIDGTSITIDNGVISAASAYTLPIATPSVLGGVKVDGTSITVTESGVISSASYTTVGETPPDTSNSGTLWYDTIGGRLFVYYGAAWVDTSPVDGYQLPTASTIVKGGVKVDGTTVVISNEVISAPRPSRSTASGTSITLAADEIDTFNITGFKSYALLKISVSSAAWVTLYTDDASRTADASRLETEDPLPGSGVIAEVITTGADTILISPGTLGFNNENIPTTSIPIKVVNKDAVSTTITVTLTLLKLED